MPYIDSYSFGRITIDGRSYTSDVLITHRGVDSTWWRVEGHRLQPEDLETVVATRPAILVIGTGNTGLMKVPQATRDWLAAQGIQVFVETTASACQRYNELAKSGADVAAALHLTC